LTGILIIDRVRLPRISRSEERRMYVCICNALTDKQIRRAVCSGACRTSEVYRHLDCVPRCGKCVAEVLDVVRAHQSEFSALPQTG
jgi:bacterioferritin-associated ferredoxin